MIAYLNFCAHDRDMALRLLRWIGQLGGCGGHELVLQPSKGQFEIKAHEELLEEARKHFGTVELFVPCTENERGWPHSPNHGWLAALTHMRERAVVEKAFKPWLWLEPDCVPLTADWLDRIEAEYLAGGKPFMGAEILHPSHRLSGVAVYPGKVIAFFRNKRLGDMHVRNEAFDAYFASEILPHAHITNLIQNVHLISRNPDLMPTFPTQESLGQLSPAAVLFHRCKDGSLIERLRERLPVSIEADKPAGAAEAVAEKAGNTREQELEAELALLKAQLRSAPQKSDPMAKARAAKAKKAETSAKLKAAWVRRKEKATA